MYLNHTTMDRSRSVSKVQWIVGGIWCGLMLFGVILGLTGDEDMKPHIGAYIAMMVPMLPVLWLAWRKDQLRNDAQRLNGLFEQDEDGYLPLGDLAVKCGMMEYKLSKRLEELMRRGYLQKCALERGQHARVVLQIQQGHAVERTIGVTCPHCGAPNTARVGFVCKCEYCGVEIPYNS